MVYAVGGVSTEKRTVVVVELPAAMRMSIEHGMDAVLSVDEAEHLAKELKRIALRIRDRGKA